MEERAAEHAGSLTKSQMRALCRVATGALYTQQQSRVVKLQSRGGGNEKEKKREAPRAGWGWLRRSLFSRASDVPDEERNEGRKKVSHVQPQLLGTLGSSLWWGQASDLGAERAVIGGVGPCQDVAWHLRNPEPDRRFVDRPQRD